jgi:hypothetical protein
LRECEDQTSQAEEELDKKSKRMFDEFKKKCHTVADTSP